MHQNSPNIQNSQNFQNFQNSPNLQNSQNFKNFENSQKLQNSQNVQVRPEAKIAKRLEISGWPWAKTTAEMFTALRCQKLANL